MGDTQYAYVIIIPNPIFFSAIDGNQTRICWFKIGNQANWNGRYDNYRTANPSFWFGNVKIVRSQNTIINGGEPVATGAGKAIENRLFDIAQPAPFAGPLQNYENNPGTEWYRTDRVQEMAAITVEWNNWAKMFPQPLADINGYLGGNLNIDTWQEQGMAGPIFPSRRAFEVYMRHLC